MHNVCFATQKCPDPFFADRFQRLVECCLIGRKEIIPNCGRACFIDHFKRPVGRLKPIDVDAYFGAILSNSTRQRRLNEFGSVIPSSAHQPIPATISDCDGNEKELAPARESRANYYSYTEAF